MYNKMKDRRGQTQMILWIFFLCFIMADAAPCKDTVNWINWCRGVCKGNVYPYNSTQQEFINCKRTCAICKTESQCGDGYYGPDCKPCMYRCRDGTCEDTRTGECPQNCQDRFYGYRCDMPCPRNCLACDQWTGVCTDCEDGYYGRSCSDRCPANCGDDICLPDTGECDYCKPTWKGDRCTEKEKICKNCAKHDCDNLGVCRNGCKDDKWFGPKCEEKCHLNCRNKTCHKDTGNCIVGCKSTFYGSNCTTTCSENCAGKKCDDKTGICKACVRGKFGDDCSSSCSPNCQSTCYRKTGKCKACKKGWYGFNCTTSCENCMNGCIKKGVCVDVCKPGYFGRKCDKACNQQCLNNECEQKSGACSQGCKDTWYGTICSSKCSSNCVDRLCTKDLGNELECLDGCVTGMKGKYCDEPCPDNCINCTENFCETCKEGFHGINCELPCPVNCEGQCRKDTGHCSACKLGYYGSDCQTSCNIGCKSSSTKVCRFDDGYCLLGCNNGSYGNQCEQTCNTNCQGLTCDRDDGSCLLGCVAGWQGSRCDAPCPSNCQECTESSCSLCKPGWYELTKECSLECSTYCLEGSCDSNGECHHGCIERFFGQKCNQTCPDANCLKCERYTGQCNQCYPFWYGTNCDDACPRCSEGNCSRISGECKEGCLPGFHGDKCEASCPNSCKRREVSNMLNIFCEKQTGRCIDGCLDGVYGDRCEDECNDTCSDKVCDQTTGYCRYGCVGGKYGDFCEETCNIKCGQGKDIQCDQKNGSCIKGCQPGYHGDYCMDRCSQGCLDDFCEQATAICTYSCKEGVTGLKCDTPCQDYRYGPDCTQTCGHCVNNVTCDRFKGNCSLGCAYGYDGLLCMERLIIAPSNVEDTSVSALPIVLAVVAIVLVALVFVIGFLVYRRRQAQTRQRNDKDYLMLPLHGNTVTNPSYSHSPAAPSKPLRTTPKKNGVVGQNGHTAMAEVHQEEGEVVYYNLMGKSPTVVRTSELWGYVQQMKNSGGFQDQYDSLPTGLIHSCNIAMLPENKGKNRYKNICAFDRSRVVLEKENDDPNSDYINANYITGYDQPKMYIASQGPVDVILIDFWRMIWQLNTCKIVMLTNIVEEGRMKCVMYWPEPDSGPIQYGNMVVECTTEDVLAHFTVRTLKICKLKQGKSKSSNTRIVKHFHFTSWPDKGVPTDVASLVEFYFKVVNTPSHGRGPMVVHCSAGIGRTGTFLALSYLIDEAKSGETVDPYRCIHRMRSERVNMVQTEEQYEFLHLALVEAIMAGGTTVATANFQTTYQDLLQMNPETGVLKMKELFETLNLMTPPLKLEEYHTATLPDNLHRNRFKEILASDYHRPFLSTPVHGTTDYINAVFLPAYKQKRAFILTQMPMVDTVIDFWRLMFESYSQTIVMLNDDNDDKLTVGFYWPQRTLKEMYGPFLVEVVEEEDYECYKVLTLKVSKPNTDSEHDCERLVKMFQCSFWPPGQIVPDTAQPLFAVIEAVEAWQIKTDQSQVTVHCLDGVERSGLYCVLSAVLERLKVEQDVSILQTINQMRVCRPQLVQSFDQFKFLYAAVHEYLETFSTYSNFT